MEGSKIFKMKHIKLFEDFIVEKGKKPSTKSKVKKITKKIAKVVGKKEDLIKTAKEMAKSEDPSGKMQASLAKVQLKQSDAEAEKLMLQRQVEVIKSKISTAKEKEKATKEMAKESEERDWNDKRRGPHPYDSGLNDTEEEDKEDQMKDQAKMDDDDPKAYKEMPGDKEARAKGKVKTSKHVKSYHELYGDETDEALSDYEEDDVDYDKIYKGYKYKRKNESMNEEKAEGDRGPIDNPDIETALKKKKEETGVPLEFLRIVMRRGMAAWRTGHRPGAGQEQWGYARVNSFLTKQEGTWGGADSDVAKEVRDGGHDKKLKKA